MHHFIYFGSFLAFPALIFVAYLFTKKPSKAKGAVFVMLLIFIYARFIETQIIQVKTTEIDLPNLDREVQVAIISDPQVGVYRSANYLQRIVNKTNALQPQYIFLPGDITYHSKLEQIPDLLRPLNQLDAPLLAVLGNHDYTSKGVSEDPNSQAISQELSILDNQILEVDDLSVAAYGSILANNFDPEIAQGIVSSKPQLALMHNPDGTHYITQQFDLTIAGHTHCGQIKIPVLYKPLVPTKFNFKAGLQESPVGPLYISCGLGESLLPMRLFNPPTIDFLILK